MYQCFEINATLLDRQVVTLTESVTVSMQVGQSAQCSLDVHKTSVLITEVLYQYFSAKQIRSHTPCDL